MKKWLTVLLPLAIVLLVGAVGFFLNQEPVKVRLPGAAQTAQSDPTPGEKLSDSIAIPGYEGITLEADQKKQTLVFPNPAQNTCLFVITLRLEDGTVLWQSGEIKPGETSEPVVLNQALEAGTYPNAVLEYACFREDAERTKLNGATTKLSLRVG